MDKLLDTVTGLDGAYLLNCPGCQMDHVIYTKNNERHTGPIWTFNNDMESPTFSPSLLVKYNWGKNDRKVVCHSFIRDGHWQFLNDCTHHLKGKTVPMTDIETEYDNEEIAPELKPK